MNPTRTAGVAALLATVLTVAAFLLQGSANIYEGDPQSFRLVAEDPFGDGQRILDDADVADQGVAYRYARVFMPLLAWVLAFGQAELVPWTLPIVGIIGFAACAWGAARLCEHAARPAERGLLVAAVPTLVTATVLAYAEPVAIALVLATYVAYLDERRRAALLLACLVVLTREAYLVGLAPLAWAEWQRLSLRHATAVVAAVVAPYAMWLTWVRWRVGGWSFRDPSTSRTDAVGAPVISPLEAIRDVDGDVLLVAGALVVAALGAAMFVVAVVIFVRSTDNRLLTGCLLAFAILGLFVGPQGYRFSGDGLRVLLPSHVLLALLAARHLRDPGAIAAGSGLRRRSVERSAASGTRRPAG